MASNIILLWPLAIGRWQELFFYFGHWLLAVGKKLFYFFTLAIGKNKTLSFETTTKSPEKSLPKVFFSL
jgi:hypothetical protein